MDPTAHTVRDRLAYDASTGVFRWRVRPTSNIPAGTRAGCSNTSGWLIVIFGVVHRARRLAWIYTHGKIPEGMEVRVLNRDESDLRLCNLELSTVRQRMERHPKHHNNKIGAQGVCKQTLGQHVRFRAKLCREGRVIHTSSHPTLEEAIAARAEALRKYEANR
ncbi:MULTISPECIES: HNH endonuclease [Agrobacterium]|uniref:HNH endonuclease n=1 Tax=Agrobacterium tumefaciens TaxID=358 RepID=A0AAE6B8N1_AGRTU|nr:MULTISPECIES: HNH endonuclease [Agrobacterium]QCL72720.1 HNH endonuclease [Agrobacterium tumefaciens]QCL78295.1 HNH endonuclease [Agrobacterium tumefaciens]CUX15228.1 putative Pathogenesis-related transcriptional factor and ERF protein [Agrobacterium sp. NCPPB 925]